MSKVEETFNILEVFKYLRLARLFYIIYTKKIFDWNNSE